MRRYAGDKVALNTVVGRVIAVVARRQITKARLLTVFMVTLPAASRCSAGW